MNRIFKVLTLVIVLNLLPLMGLAVAGSYSKELQVTIFYPYEGDLILNSPMPVRGAVSHPLAKVTINGTPVVVAENGYFEGAADLVKGKNTIRIIANIEGREQVIKKITVTYSPKK